MVGQQAVLQRDAPDRRLYRHVQRSPVQPSAVAVGGVSEVDLVTGVRSFYDGERRSRGKGTVENSDGVARYTGEIQDGAVLRGAVVACRHVLQDQIPSTVDIMFGRNMNTT